MSYNQERRRQRKPKAIQHQIHLPSAGSGKVYDKDWPCRYCENMQDASLRGGFGMACALPPDQRDDKTHNCYSAPEGT